MKTNYILAIDIGNSSISFGLFKSARLLRCWHGSFDNIPKIKRFISSSGIDINKLQIIIDSVSPKKMSKLRVSLKRSFGQRNLLITGKNVRIKINHKYRNFNKLGQDRVVNLVGALEFYKFPVLVIDFGTAITFDVISKQGTFEGGLIVPGVETAWAGLQDRAVLLPKFDLKAEIIKRKRLVGDDTKSCMTSGIGHSYGAMTDGLIDQFKVKYGKNLIVLVTGGFSRFVQSHIRHRIKVDPHHTLKSLALIADRVS